MRPRFNFGDQVRVTRNVRDDGTFPGANIGNLLVRRGSVGYVRDVGTFLQDQLVYSVHFFDQQKMVGCREEELIGADEPWNPSQFEFREKVTPKVALVIDGETIASPGDVGQVLKVLRDLPSGVGYHVRFPGRTLQIPEKLLDSAPADAPDLADLPDEEDADD
ncbi:nitrogen fixation protein NifZ [Candidatus Thiothrix sp. Deng01]|uniref:Nitrogen fixation protein NifZ n=1 Tax=Candidatus Thiothrix phosphatis TaxID=3112415 RepID=A0ABU6CVZ7_9GAMM|nr:nitrogen fixation protein NifZ [Candidatus Thiothrix sp. Deng01]MEB4590717.1 nitrogen fixation protein NifZ [Candidatus Thiothrix sp. Deng01]